MTPTQLNINLCRCGKADFQGAVGANTPRQHVLKPARRCVDPKEFGRPPPAMVTMQAALRQGWGGKKNIGLVQQMRQTHSYSRLRNSVGGRRQRVSWLSTTARPRYLLGVAPTTQRHAFVDKHVSTLVRQQKHLCRQGVPSRRDGGNDNDNDTLREVRPTIVRGLALQA